MLAEIANVNTLLAPETPSDEGALIKLHQRMQVFAPGYKYVWTYKKGEWDGKTELVTDVPGGIECPTGYLHTVLGYCSSAGVNTRIRDGRQLSRLTLQSTTVPLRDYQWEACKSVFSNTWNGLFWPRGIVRIATGGGKTETAAAIVEMANLPTLFLVHRKDLLHQAYERFNKYGLSCSRFGDNYPLDPSDVIVCTVQTLARHLDSDDVVAMMDERQMVIVDEAHSIAASLDKGNQFSQVLKQMPNAFIRLGLTATPFLRDRYSNQLLEGATGKVLIDINARYLIDKDYLSDAEIKMIQIPALPYGLFKAPQGKKTSKFQMAYTTAIELLDIRNERILDELKQLPGPNLILVKTIAHGEILSRRAAARGIALPFINGRNSRPERKAAVDHLAATNGNLMTTGIFDEGIDIPSLRGLILAAGGKSEGRALQRLGRGLRKWSGKKGLKVIDFYDLSKPLRPHSEGRKKLWQSEGYTVNVVT